ncbi:type I-C CRISPR-associated protein Cas7/Csd2 [Peptoniphilus stercorisuis]|uniref:CRISPR-associated protein Csd2 n=1 Tax=Peptoniphilus stercorisuis TaxID=1436965 RepID=A0ABS4K9T6_9FIRM|nr:type I-C CRISPR-associated protein Cas7/Csd2 [Peptoniphilus stercorisuis]MBP2024532.1 CRISPR-associated protein Csd2 [Peptoniphilus stercorisuis]
MILENKIDFIMYFTVIKANPNGDPLNGNRPRIDYNGYGEVSDVCIKRKIRDRLIESGEDVFVQNDDKRVDEHRSLKDRYDALKKEKGLEKADEDVLAKAVCENWIDVRSFGQVFAFSGDKLSIGIRGPVSIQTAESKEEVEISSMQITKSVNSTTNKKNPSAKTPDTMGMKHRVEFGTYKVVGTISPQLAEKTGFTEKDAETVKKALINIFENDYSSARPAGSMEVNKLYWFKHNSKLGKYSPAEIHSSVDLKIIDPEKNSFDRYEIVENIPKEFKKEEEGKIVNLIGK